MVQGWIWEDLVTSYGGHKAGYVSTKVGASIDIKVWPAEPTPGPRIPSGCTAMHLIVV